MLCPVCFLAGTCSGTVGNLITTTAFLKANNILGVTKSTQSQGGKFHIQQFKTGIKTGESSLRNIENRIFSHTSLHLNPHVCVLERRDNSEDNSGHPLTPRPSTIHKRYVAFLLNLHERRIVATPLPGMRKFVYCRLVAKRLL